MPPRPARTVLAKLLVRLEATPVEGVATPVEGVVGVVVVGASADAPGAAAAPPPERPAGSWRAAPPKAGRRSGRPRGTRGRSLPLWQGPPAPGRPPRAR